MPRGTKTCPACNNTTGPRSRVCPTCGHVFQIATKPATAPRSAQNTPLPETAPIPTPNVSPTPANPIHYPSGPCPFPINEKASDSEIKEWIQKVHQHGIENKKNYTKKAILYWARMSTFKIYEGPGKEFFNRVTNIIHTMEEIQ
jgi:hypothetical protein